MANISPMKLLLQQLPHEIRDEVQQELEGDDPIVRNVKYKCFVSTSKGIRNGKQRKRKHLKEVELINYVSNWHYPHKAYIDKMNQELTHETLTDDEFMDYIRCNCGK